MTVTVYSKPNCVQCTATKTYLTNKGIDFNTVDITQDLDSFDLVVSKGFMSAPVVNAGEEWWSGFQPDKLDTIQ
jgi:glutaredoxin-like protein NrdH